MKSQEWKYMQVVIILFSLKIFQMSQNFQTFLQHILWRNKHKSHFVVFITSFLHLI